MWMSCGEPGPAPALLPSATERLRLEEEVATITARMQGDAARLQQAQAQLGSSVVPPPALALAPALALPSHDTTKNGLIFVSVACFRDPECQWTLHNLFQTAADPHRIRVGVVWQVRPPAAPFSRESTPCWLMMRESHTVLATTPSHSPRTPPRWTRWRTQSS